MAFIRLENVSQQLNRAHILKDINLAIERGEVFGVIGPTGAGKTTLIRLLDLLDSPASGRIVFDGVDVTRSRSKRLSARRRMAYVQQKPIVFSMNVFDNVACGLKWRHEHRESIREKVQNTLSLVGMADYAGRDAKTLSGGETQRVAIARSLVTDPEVLLLDEPTANLDPISTAKIEDILETITKSKHLTVVISTHDMSQGQRLADRIGVMMGGELLQVGTPNEVFHSPRNTRVADFVGMANVLPGVITAKEANLATIVVGGRALQAVADCATGDTVWALIRPEDIVFAPSQTSASAQNTFEGSVTKVSRDGALVRIEIDCGFPLVGIVTARSAEELGMETGKRLLASFKPAAVHAIPRYTRSDQQKEPDTNPALS